MWERLQFEKRFHFLDPGKVMSPVQPVLPLCKSKQTSYFKKRSLDLTLSDFPAGNPEYVQTTPADTFP